MATRASAGKAAPAADGPFETETLYRVRSKTLERKSDDEFHLMTWKQSGVQPSTDNAASGMERTKMSIFTSAQ
ncbi:hypothetical protein E4U43_001904 [Claviceps pusilla]|uniref:Uncharacterized protein n=1 Tax=Claviceps pusilla TaxID=123648 RepID=A0A9P7N7V3_9HYPO|nr:hypothetical protein E4U43_001904 [Claviceps pusilla]